MSFENHAAGHLVEEGLADRVHCAECGKGFNTDFHLRKHMDNVHPMDKKYHKCPLCDLVFASETTKRTHVDRDHKGQVLVITR